MQITTKKRVCFKAVLLSLSLQCPDAMALPSEGEVASGNATITSPTSNEMLINQSSDKAIINWNSFNVNQGEQVQFVVPTSTSATLNRVTGGDPASIMGTLKSNGQLWLIDPHGVMFGAGSEVNAASLVASTLNIQDSDFLSGNYSLQQEGDTLASVVNEGHITAQPNGFVALLAPQVENKGVIDARLGTVALGTGKEATLQLAGNRMLSFAVSDGASVPMYDENGNPIAALSNSGEIHADGGEVLLTSESVDSLLDQSINMTGIIRANTVTDVPGVGTQPGKIVLSAVAEDVLDNATIEAQGGNVEVLGQDVGLFDNTSINALGGNIHVGKDADDPNGFEAADTIVDPNVSLTANFVETSGDILQEESSNIYANTWLLDPDTVTISTAPNSNNITSSTPFESNNDSPATLNSTTLTNALNNSPVTVETTNNGDIDIDSGANIQPSGTYSLTLLSSGNINISSGVTVMPGKSLTLDAGRGGAGNIDIEGTLQTGSTGILTLNAYNSALTDTTGTITLGSAGSIVTLGSGASNILAGAGIDLATGSTVTNNGTGTLTFNADGAPSSTAGINSLGTITSNGSVTLRDNSASFIPGQVAIALLGDVTVASGRIFTVTASSGDINQNTGKVSAGNTTLNAQGNIDLARSSNSLGYVNATTTGSGSSITLVDGNADGMELEGSTSNGNISATSAGQVTLFGDVTTGTGTLNLTSSSAGITQNAGTVTANNTIVQSSGSTTLSQMGGSYGTISTAGSGVHGLSVTETDTTPITLGAITDTGTLSVSTNNADISGSGALDISGTTTLDAGSSDITLTNSSNDFGDQLVTLTGDNISLNDTDTTGLDLGSVTGSGNVTLNALGTNESIAVNADIISGGTTTLTASGSGSITGSDTGVVNGGQPIGTVDLTSGSGAINLYVDTPDLTFNTTGDVTITSTYISGLTLTGNSTGNNITIDGGKITTTAPTSGASIAATGTLALDTRQLGGAIILGGNIQGAQVNLVTPGGASSITTTGGTITATTGTKIDANTGNIGSSSHPLTGNFGDAPVALTGADVYLTDTNTTGLTLGGVYITGNAAITAAKAITQSTATLEIDGATNLAAGSGSNITLTNSNNDFGGALTASGKNVTVVDSGTLALQSINATGNVILAATQLDNLSGSGAITTGAGDAWDIYLTNLGGNTFNGLTSGNQAIWGTSYPTAISQTGDRYIFATTETLALTPESPIPASMTLSKTYGNTITLPTLAGGTNYQASGFVRASDYSNVFTQDTINNVTTSGLNFASTGTPALAPVGSYNINLPVGGATPTTNTGYDVSYNPNDVYGTLIVNPRSSTGAYSTQTNPAIVAKQVEQSLPVLDKSGKFANADDLAQNADTNPNLTLNEKQ